MNIENYFLPRATNVNSNGAVREDANTPTMLDSSDDHGDKQGETGNKRARWIAEENRSFQPEWETEFFIEIEDQPTCLICKETISVCKRYNLQRHFKTKHRKSIEARYPMGDERQVIFGRSLGTINYDE